MRVARRNVDPESDTSRNARPEPEPEPFAIDRSHTNAGTAGNRRTPMNHLIVIAFDHFDDARNAMAALRTLESAGQVQFEDTAVVERDPDGTAHVRNEVSGTTETATAIGAVIGGLVTFMFPLAGIALGAAPVPSSAVRSTVGSATGSSMRSSARCDPGVRPSS